MDERLDVLEAQIREPEDTRFDVWRTEDRDAWRDVSAQEKNHLWAIYLLCGGGDRGTAMPYRLADGRWWLATFALPFGRAAYCLGQTRKDIGDNAFVAWAGTQCTADELAALARMCQRCDVIYKLILHFTDL